MQLRAGHPNTLQPQELEAGRAIAAFGRARPSRRGPNSLSTYEFFLANVGDGGSLLGQR